jgi:hypothetical protein
MSAHRTLNDFFRAFDATGPGRLQDPGDAKTITIKQWGQVCPVVTTGVQTRTLAQPTKAGIMAAIVLDVDGGDLTLTVTGGYNQANATTIVFGDAGDYVVLYSIKVGTAFYWRVIGQEGTNASVSALTLNDTVVSANDMTQGSGFTGAGSAIEHSVTRVGDLIKTEILIDLTGLNGGGTADDIIGKDGEANCHFGQITAAKNGTIFAGEMRCLEAPAGSNTDIDLNTSTVATGAEDAAVPATAAQLLNAGAWSVNTFKGLTAFPAADTYLYLTSGTATAATFTAGIFVITLWGK